MKNARRALASGAIFLGFSSFIAFMIVADILDFSGIAVLLGSFATYCFATGVYYFGKAVLLVHENEHVQEDAGASKEMDTL